MASGSLHIPLIGTLLSLTVAAGTVSTLPGARSWLRKSTGLSLRHPALRILFLFYILANLKSLPLVWHIRTFRAFILQLYTVRPAVQPRDLFKPLVLRGARTPLFECDFNAHKSNSTYFSDLDVARAHLVTCVLRHGIRRLEKPDPAARREVEQRYGMPVDERGEKGSYAIMLGGVSCHFKREIKPYQGHEIWTRVLAWDRKWIYFVSHIVKPGTARAGAYCLQPSRKGKAAKSWDEMSKEEREREKERLKSAVYATSIAKYVVKRGRLTIPPELVLERSLLLPPRPDGVETPAPSTQPPAVGGQESVASLATSGVMVGVSPEQEAMIPEPSEEWNWAAMQKENERGLRFAKAFAALDELHDEFDGGRNGALGEYGDLFL